MAQCKQSPQEFIKNAFTPQIAVMRSPLAEKCCEKNNLDFIELLQPFSKLTSDVHYKDPTGLATTIKNLKLTFLDIKSRPPQTAIARKLLNSSVSDAPEPRNNLFQSEEYKLDVPSSTPWFESWRDTFLKVQYPSDHEFTKHFLACILVVSSSDTNPVETIVELAQSLNQIQSTAPGQLPKWFSSNVLKYYVILHDNVEGNTTIATEAFDSLKVSYGATYCFLLRMNSRPPGPTNTEYLPDPWSQFISNQIDTLEMKITPENSPNSKRHVSLEIGQEANEVRSETYHPLSPDTDDLMLDALNDKDENIPRNPNKQKVHGNCLSVDDVEQVKLLVYEFTRCCLLPYIEKQMIMLNDVISNKKGMSKSLFSATKRWFSPNKPGASSVAVNNLIYAPDSPELQVRRLGDLFFMFGNYNSAFQAYHLAKRDYNSDQAWLYYAGALEMAALSAFMANETTRKTFDYMEESITTYLLTCKMPQFATRATILSSECLKHKSMYGEAATQLIRMTSEESDLRSALLLEQAAYCFLQSKMVRKYAFHMVLAGHRFSKAAQRKHSLKCYKQAYQIYENTGWDLASDHIHYTIGRQANNLQHYEEAVESFSQLLKGGSQQSAQQQAVFLKEYLTILENKLKNYNLEGTSIPDLPVPELDNSSIKVLLGPTRPLSTPGKIPALGVNFSNSDDIDAENKWNKLEEMVICEACASLPMMFKPMITLYTVNKLEKNNPIAIINEPIQVSVQLVNDLQTVLLLKDIYLLWNFHNETEDISNEVLDTSVDQYVKTYVTKSMIVQGNSKQELILSLTPLTTGTLKITGVCYVLTGSHSTTDTIFVKGRKLFKISNSSNEEIPVEIKIVPSAPCLQVTFSEMNCDFLANEMQRVSIDFQNTGTVSLKNIYMATSVPHLLCNCEFKPPDDYIVPNDIESQAMREKIARKNHITSVPLPHGKLENGQSITIHIWVKAPNKKGLTSIDLLTYYENVDSKSIPRYRLVRHKWNLTVQESIAVDISSQTSYNSQTEEELALAIKSTNLNKTHDSISTEITLVNVGLFSKNWALMKDVVTPKYINLGSQQSAHILLKAKRAVRYECHYSCARLTAERKAVPHLTIAYLGFARKTEKRMNNIFENAENSKENKDGFLYLQWQALVSDSKNQRIVYGQTHIPVEVNRREDDQIQLERILSDTIIDINEKTVTIDHTAELAQKQVFYNLLYAPVVEHNFEENQLCIVTITLLLHSIVDANPINVTINTVESSAKLPVTNKAASKSNLFFPHASNHFSWIGNGKILRTLNPLSTETVEMSVVVSNPGTFDLGAHIKVLCNKVDDSEPPVLQSCQIHSALIVVNTKS